MSFRLKTIIGIAAIEFVVMAVIIILNQFNFGGTASDQFEARAKTTTGLISTLLRDAVIATDLATVDAIVGSVLENGDFVYLRVRSPNGFVLSEGGDPTALSRRFVEDQSYEDAVQDQILDISSPIGVSAAVYGFVEAGYSTEVVDAEIANAVLWNVIGAAIGILLVAAFGNMLGSILTRQLSILRDGAQAIQAGNLDVRIPVKGRDELAQTALFFNNMADALEADRADLLEQQRTLTEKRDSANVLSDVMLEIANGKSVEDIPGITREDEIGGMARATKVFQMVMAELETSRRDQGRLIKAFDRVKDGVLIFDSNNKSLFMNATASQFFADCLEGRSSVFSVSDLLSGAKETAFLAAEAGMSQSDVWEAFEQVLDGDGQVREFLTREGRHILMHGTSVGPVGAVVTTTDVTELRASQAQVVHASKLSTLGEMAAGMAHELNQPLGVIRMSASNSKRRVLKGTAETDYLVGKLERIADQTERAAKIIDHMRVFGRKDEDVSIEFSPREALMGAVDMMKAQLSGTSIEIVESISDTDCVATGPAVMFEQVLVNLISNGRDAIVSNYAEPDLAKGRITVSARSDVSEGMYEIQISDTGGGIPEDVIAKLFEPFFTTKAPGKGTGLGLSISYSIVSGMKGEISAENIMGGACFRIKIPVAYAEEAAL